MESSWWEDGDHTEHAACTFKIVGTKISQKRVAAHRSWFPGTTPPHGGGVSASGGG